MSRYGVRVAPYDDTMLMAYACDQGRGGLAGFGMDELSKRHFRHTPIAFNDVAGRGKSQTAFDCVPVDKATEYAAEDADVTLRLWTRSEGAARGRGHGRGLRDFGAAYGCRARRDGACGRHGGPLVLSRLSGDSPKVSRGSRTRSMRWPARSSTSAPRSRWRITVREIRPPWRKKTSTGTWSTGARFWKSSSTARN